MVLKRLIQPLPTHNEKVSLYHKDTLTEEEVVKWLLSANDGVFGVEAIRTPYKETHYWVTPNFYKPADGWEPIDDILPQFLDINPKEVTYAQLYLTKPSLFPLSMGIKKAIWNGLKHYCPTDITLFYQFLFQYRQDNWVHRLAEQYDDYLEGVEQPSDNQFIRKFQRILSSKIDEVFKWQYRHEPIDDIETKLKQEGYRFCFRLILVGGVKKRRVRVLQNLINVLNSIAYLNHWGCSEVKLTEDIRQNILLRKFSGLGKQDVLTVSELTPFLMKQLVETENQSIPTSASEPVNKPLELNRNSLLDLLPKGEPLSELDGMDYANKFIRAVKELLSLEEELKLKRIQSGSTLMKLVFDMPKGLKMSQLIRRGVKEDLQVAIGVKSLVIEQGDNVGEVAIFVPLEERRIVLLRDYIDTQAFHVFAKSHTLPFLAGVDTVGEPIFRDVSKAKHILIGGTTGSGKSTFVNQLILTIALFKSPEDVHMFLIDTKQVELTQFRKLPHVQKVITDVNESISLLENLIVEMRARYDILDKAGVKNISIYNDRNPTNKLPYILCVVDEYADLTLDNKEVHKHVQSIAQLARAVGIHLIIATQDPRKEVIPPIIKSNIPSKVGFLCTNENSYLTFLRAKPYFKLLGYGDGVLAFDGQMEDFIRFQSCLIVNEKDSTVLESELIDRIADELNRKYRNVGKSSFIKDNPQPDGVVEDPELRELSDLERLKLTIIEHNETRVGPLRELMRCNMKKLMDLMRELVEEGFLAEPETRQSGYKLIADEAEMERLRRVLAQRK